MDDDAMIRLIQDSPQEGVPLFVTTHGPPAKGYLRNQFARVLSPQEIDEVFSDSLRRLWQYAKSFDPTRGSLLAWFLRLAQRQALDCLKSKRRPGVVSLDLNEHDRGPTDYEEPSESIRQLLADMDYVITHELQGLQQVIVRADLASEDVADADSLAAAHGTTTNSIYVSRKKARDNIKKRVAERARKRQLEGDEE